MNYSLSGFFSVVWLIIQEPRCAHEMSRVGLIDKLHFHSTGKCLRFSRSSEELVLDAFLLNPGPSIGLTVPHALLC